MPQRRQAKSRKKSDIKANFYFPSLGIHQFCDIRVWGSEKGEERLFNMINLLKSSFAHFGCRNEKVFCIIPKKVLKNNQIDVCASFGRC
jgi:hypothetical protein